MRLVPFVKGGKDNTAMTKASRISASASEYEDVGDTGLALEEGVYEDPPEPTMTGQHPTPSDKSYANVDEVAVNIASTASPYEGLTVNPYEGLTPETRDSYEPVVVYQAIQQ